jgi:hypothetical protein
VWVDGHKRARGDPNYLTLWQPVAPAGYVAMGALASTGTKEPDMSKVGHNHKDGDGLICHLLACN